MYGATSDVIGKTSQQMKQVLVFVSLDDVGSLYADDTLLFVPF